MKWRKAREAILREPDFGLAYLVLADVHVGKGLYWMQLKKLDTYLKLDPRGPAHERLKQAREEVQRMLVQARAQD
jgi:hypothetical protein